MRVMLIREVTRDDIPVWSKYRTILWPNTSDRHLSEINDYFSGQSIDIEAVFVIEDEAGQVAGFMELNIREFAEGSRHPKVPYVEAWYVDPQFQNQGFGKLLMQRAEAWAREQGFTELASDTEVSNTRSIALHKHLGFVETERVVCFLKKLD